MYTPSTKVPTDGSAEGESRRVLAEEIGASVDTFSYPNGDWNPTVAALVLASGFRLSFSTRRGSVTANENPCSIHRVNVHEDVTSTDALFLARIVGAL